MWIYVDEILVMHQQTFPYWYAVSSAGVAVTFMARRWKFSCRSCWDSNPGSFSHVSDAVTT